MSLADQSQQWFPTSVQVTVLQARNLRIKGKNGTNDAYAIMQVAKDKFSTSVAEKCVAPVWKEEASFDLPLFHNGNADRCTLHVHVMHRALVGPDKLLGQAVVNLLELEENKARSKTAWSKLLDKSGKADKDRGEVLLDIQFMKNNMTASMFDLSGPEKSRSRMGKLKDKIRGKKKEGLSDSASAVVPSFTQVLTDSEGEGEGEGEGGGATSTPKKKKNKLKSLFVPKSNLQRNASQSMSTLGPLPERDSALGSSRSSGLNVDSPEGKKKFKFLTHKRTGSSDSRSSLGSFSGQGHPKQAGTLPSNLCINGSHVYAEEPETKPSRAGSTFSLSSSGHGSMEDLRRNSAQGRTSFNASVESLRATGSHLQAEEEQEREEERKRREEEKRRLEEEETERLEKEREEQEQRRMQEERARMEREAEEERKRFEEEEERIKKEEEEEERLREEGKRRAEEERVRKEQERRRLEEEEGIRREEEEKRERMERDKEEERWRIEEESRKEEERMRLEEEEKVKREEERRKEEERRIEEEERRKEEERRIEEEERRKEEERRMEGEKRRKEQERMMEDEKRRKEQERMMEEEERRKEQERRIEEEEGRIQEERERIWREEEERKELERQKEEEMKREEEGRKAEEKEERRRIEEGQIRKEEERRIDEEKERMRNEEEERNKAEDERMKKEEERKMLKEEERMRREKEESKRIEREEEEERTRIEEERIRKDKAMRLQEEKEIIRREGERIRVEREEKAREEQERQKDEERMKREEEARQRDEEERVRMEEEEQIRREEERKKTEREDRRRQEEQDRRKREEEEEEEEKTRSEQERMVMVEREQDEEQRKSREVDGEEQLGRDQLRHDGPLHVQTESTAATNPFEDISSTHLLAEGLSTTPFEEPSISANPFEDHSVSANLFEEAGSPHDQPSHSTKASTVKPSSTSIGFQTPSNPFLPSDEHENAVGFISGSSENLTEVGIPHDRTEKKRRAPSPPTKKLGRESKLAVHPRTSAPSSEGQPHPLVRESDGHGAPDPPSSRQDKRPAPKPPVHLRKVEKAENKEEARKGSAPPTGSETMTVCQPAECDVPACPAPTLASQVFRNALQNYGLSLKGIGKGGKTRSNGSRVGESVDSQNSDGSNKQATSETSTCIQPSHTTNPFLEPKVAKHNKGPAPKPQASGLSEQPPRERDQGGLALKTADPKLSLSEEPSNVGSHRNGGDFSDGCTVEEPKRQDEAEKFLAQCAKPEDQRRGDHRGDPQGESADRMAKPCSAEEPKGDSLSRDVQKFPNLDILTSDECADGPKRISDKRNRAPLPPANTPKTPPHSQGPISLVVNPDVTALPHGAKAVVDTPGEAKAPSVVTQSPSGQRVRLHARVSPSDALPVSMPNRAVEDVCKTGGSTSMPRRPHAVKPLNAQEPPPAPSTQAKLGQTAISMAESARTCPRAGTTVPPAEPKGPYSQLTQEELISLVLRQQDQLAQRRSKILELEEYIDNLILRVIEEQPSILMSLNALKKGR